jgi:hypothetical protein
MVFKSRKSIYIHSSLIDVLWYTVHPSGCFPTRFLEIQAYHYDSFKWSLFQFLQPIILLFFKFILWIWLTWSEQSLPSIHDGHHANETSFKGMIDGRSYSKITRICIRWAIQAEPSESLVYQLSVQTKSKWLLVYLSLQSYDILYLTLEAIHISLVCYLKKQSLHQSTVIEQSKCTKQSYVLITDHEFCLTVAGFVYILAEKRNDTNFFSKNM